MKSYDKVKLDELIERSRKCVKGMTEEQKAAMLKEQAEGWARSEAQWAKDFREGKCELD